MPRRPVALAAALLAGLVFVTPAAGKASHAGWPGDLRLIVDRAPAGRSVTLRGLATRHNELLGGDANDTIYGGPLGDVIWADYRPSGQPTTQVDVVRAGDGDNFIYTSHGTNTVFTGSGHTVVHAHFGRGVIHCVSTREVVLLSHHSAALYRTPGCRRAIG